MPDIYHSKPASVFRLKIVSCKPTVYNFLRYLIDIGIFFRTVLNKLNDMCAVSVPVESQRFFKIKHIIVMQQQF